MDVFILSFKETYITKEDKDIYVYSYTHSYLQSSEIFSYIIFI